jgi:AcrR family transcriptional regulator
MRANAAPMILARASVRMIAQRAGISQGLMYNYFESKEHAVRNVRDPQPAMTGCRG